MTLGGLIEKQLLSMTLLQLKENFDIGKVTEMTSMLIQCTVNNGLKTPIPE